MDLQQLESQVAVLERAVAGASGDSLAPNPYSINNEGDIEQSAASLPPSVVSRSAMAAEGSVLDLYTIYPEDFAAELGIKPNEEYGPVFMAITEFIRKEAAEGNHAHFKIRLKEKYLLNGNPVTTLGGNSIWPLPGHGDTPCIIELECAPGNTTLETTREGDTYSAEHGPPSIIGGPTNEQMGINNHFSAVRLVIKGTLATSAPNNPAIAGQNYSRIPHLKFDYLVDSAKNATSTEPAHAHAFGIYLPEGDNSAELTGKEIKASGRFVGLVANSAHTCVQNLNLFNNLLDLGVTGNEQYSGNDGHSSFISYLQTQESKYHIAGWSPTGGVIPLPSGHPAQIGWGLWDIEDHRTTEEAWYKTTAHVLDTNNQLTGGGKYGRVEGNVGRVSGPLILIGGARLELRDITLASSEGSHVGVFGDGSDGEATLNGAAGVGWASRAESTYTMTRDCFCTILKIDEGVTLKTQGYRIFATVEVVNKGTIENVGAAGGATGTPAEAGHNGVYAGGTAGGTGNAGAGNVGANVSGGFGVGAGGEGGAGSGFAGATGGTVVAATVTFVYRGSVSAVLAACQNFGGVVRNYAGGAGGGGGGGDGTHKGGGGGAGGGLLVMLSPVVLNEGTITVTGGAGGTPTEGNAGGGGGGGGGAIVVYTLTPWTAGTTHVNGGGGGGKVGTGTEGKPGANGTLLNVVLK